MRAQETFGKLPQAQGGIFGVVLSKARSWTQWSFVGPYDFVIVIIPDDITEPNFKLHLGHRTKAKPNVIFLHLTENKTHVLSYPAPPTPKDTQNDKEQSKTFPSR